VRFQIGYINPAQQVVEALFVLHLILCLCFPNLLLSHAANVHITFAERMPHMDDVQLCRFLASHAAGQLQNQGIKRIPFRIVGRWVDRRQDADIRPRLRPLDHPHGTGAFTYQVHGGGS